MNLLPLLLVFVLGTSHGTSKYPYLPDPELTPGVIASTDTAEVCKKDYPSRARKVSQSTKRRVYKTHCVNKVSCKRGCKIDHLVPLSIGGSNHIQNLWPHEYGADWSVSAKTRLEVRLRKEVCAGALPIIEAQACIRLDWTKCFLRFYDEGERHGKDHQSNRPGKRGAGKAARPTSNATF